MSSNPSTLLRRLNLIRDRFGDGHAAEKRTLIDTLAGRRLGTPRDVHRFHEILCFLQAWPDDPAVLETVERALGRFADRSDLRRFAGRLVDTGIAGTVIRYPFYWSTARWLEARRPGRLSIDWKAFSGVEKLDSLLFQLLPYGETLALDEADLTTREWIDLVKRPDEGDAAFVLRRIARLDAAEDIREKLFEDMEMPFRLAPGPGGPTRTGVRRRESPTVFQSRPLDRARPDVRAACAVPPIAIRPVPPREGERLIAMARDAMVTRARDLYSFKFADPRDVRIVDCGEGLEFAAMGLLPERRLMLDSVYGFLTLKNGVPVGYVLTSAFFNSAEVAYNVFESFRGGESARIYGRVLAMVRHLFGADTFTVDPYQLGHENDEGLRSGAWWFYYKLGFRPRDPETLKLVRRELGRLKADPAYRSSRSTLNTLSAVNVFYHIGRERTDVRGLIPLDPIGLAVSRRLGERFGSDRERGLAVSAGEARKLLGVRSFAGWSAGERLWWTRWSPLMLALPGVERWTPAERRALVAVARAKGGRSENDYVRRFDAHPKLRRALLKLAAGAAE